MLPGARLSNLVFSDCKPFLMLVPHCSCELLINQNILYQVTFQLLFHDILCPKLTSIETLWIFLWQMTCLARIGSRLRVLGHLDLPRQKNMKISLRATKVSTSEFNESIDSICNHLIAREANLCLFD